MTRRGNEVNALISCGCGCGETLLKFDNWNRSRRFIKGHSSRGEFNSAWKHGEYRERYVKSGNTRKHRKIWEEHYNCCLLPWITLHHINNKPKDNRIENLQPVTYPEHGRIHHPKQDFSDRYCAHCGSNKTTRNKKHDYSYWYRNPENKDTYLCNICFLKYRRSIK